MEELGRVFFKLNAGVAFLTLYVQWLNYRKIRSGRRAPIVSSKEATDFILHFSISMWWVLGCMVVALTQLNGLWLIGWFAIGFVLMMILMRVVDVSSLPMFIAAGESVLQQMVNERVQQLEEDLGGQPRLR